MPAINLAGFSLSIDLLYALRMIPSFVCGSAFQVELPAGGFYHWLEWYAFIVLICNEWSDIRKYGSKFFLFAIKTFYERMAT